LFFRSQIAIKIVSDPAFHKAALYEHYISKNLSHPNVLPPTKCFTGQNGELALVSEWAAAGDLFTRIDTNSLTRSQIKKYFLHVIDGLSYIHSQGIIHRDIKPENIVIDGKDIARICDFGMAEFEGEIAFSGTGTMPYMAPELLHDHNIIAADASHDVWSLGVVLFVLLTGSFPWRSARKSDIEYAKFLKGELNSDAWSSLSPEMIQLLSRAFAPQDERCDLEDLRDITSIRWYADDGIEPAAPSFCTKVIEHSSSSPLAELKKPIGFQVKTAMRWSLKIKSVLKKSNLSQQPTFACSL